jgi:hypothetical protein
MEARMLEGQRIEPDCSTADQEPRKLLMSEELLASLAAIEREISAFIRACAEEGAIAAEKADNTTG